MPALVGIVADRWIPAQLTLSSVPILIASAFMIATGYSAYTQLAAGGALEFGPIFTLYTISVAFFMPTIGLSNSVAFNGLERNGLSTIDDFPYPHMRHDRIYMRRTVSELRGHRWRRYSTATLNSTHPAF